MSRWRLDLRSLLARRPRLVVGIDARHAAWRLPAASATSGTSGTSGTSATSGAPAAPALFDCASLDLADSLPPGRWQLHLVTSPDVAVHWVQHAPRAVRGLGELRQVAAARCVQLFGGSPADWRITGDWRRQGPFVCAALPERWARQIEAPLHARRADVHWHTSWGWLCAQAGAALPAEGWVALRSRARVMLWRCAGGAVVHIAQLHVTPAETTATLVSRTLEHLRLETIGTSGTEATTLRTLHWIDLCEAGPAPLPEPTTVALDLSFASTADACLPPHEAAATLRLDGLRVQSPRTAAESRGHR